MCCDGTAKKTVSLRQAPDPRLMSVRVAVCTNCAAFRALNGVCERTGEHAMSRIGRGRLCPVGKHTTGEILYWVRGAWAALKVWLRLIPQSRNKARRLKACAGCDRLDGRTCKACGCNVDWKASDENQACPLGRWEQ